MTAAPAIGAEHSCPLRVSAHCTPPTSGRPKRAKCPACSAALVTHEGTYAVVAWRGDGRYDLDQAVATHAREATARRRAERQGPDYVVRFLPL